MDYDKKLIEKAEHSTCRICLEHITEPEADSQEFHAAKTSRGFNFVHTRCWMKEVNSTYAKEKRKQTIQ
jgi:E3 ubiquitin-protein ligase DOA10